MSENNAESHEQDLCLKHVILLVRSLKTVSVKTKAVAVRAVKGNGGVEVSGDTAARPIDRDTNQLLVVSFMLRQLYQEGKACRHSHSAVNLGTHEPVRTLRGDRSLAVRKIEPMFLGCSVRDCAVLISVRFQY
jgi:hypothetical protein